MRKLKMNDKGRIQEQLKERYQRHNSINSKVHVFEVSSYRFARKLTEPLADTSSRILCEHCASL